jgi:hypothetical protein
MVGFGINPKAYNEWISTFSEDMFYAVADQTFVTGLNKVREYLQGENKFAPPLSYTVYDLSCKGTMATLLLGNNLTDGNSFLLSGYTFFNPDGKAKFNIDIYHRVAASLEVAHTLITPPGDAKHVAAKNCPCVIV